MAHNIKPHTFKLSDESLNSYGFWIRTSGIDLEQFKKNPVMLYDHRSYSMMPIGRWENIRIENDELLADAVFDQDDENAKLIESKVENGFLKGVSIGFDYKELSDSAQDLKPGQTRSTVTKSVIVEASITPFPSNSNALKLHHNGQIITLSADSAELNQAIPNLKQINMNEVKRLLGLSDNATERDIETAVAKLKTERETAVNELAATRTERIDKLMKHADVTDENKESLRKLAETDFQLAEKTLELLSKKSTMPDKNFRLSKGVAQPNTGTEETFDTLQKSNPERLSYLRDNEPETFKKLVENHVKSK